MIKPAFLFTDHGILQRDKAVRIFGECDGATLNICYLSYSVSAAIENGRFIAELPAMPGGLCGELIFSSEAEELRLTDVVTGDVWLAGGQSNMEHPTFCTYYNEEDVAADAGIRVFTVPRRPFENADKIGWHFYTASHSDTPWQLFDSESAMTASAVATFFAKRIRREVDIPIGILNCNLGASNAETWISEKALLENATARFAYDQYEKEYGKIDTDAYHSRYLDFISKLREWNEKNGSALDIAKSKGVQHMLKNGFGIMLEKGPYYYQRPCHYRRTMLDRVIPFAIKGVLWYQGESNTHDAPPDKDHEEWVLEVMHTLISDWRKNFCDPLLPFYIVQLSAYASGGSECRSWTPVKNAHEHLGEENGVYTVVSYDIGEELNIHPANKKPVGERLACAALANEYGIDIAWRSPKVKDVNRERDGIYVSFTDTTALHTDGDEVLGFFITDKEGKLTKANAEIVGDRVKLSDASEAVEVGFCNINYAPANLYNEHGLPPFPFSSPISD